MNLYEVSNAREFHRNSQFYFLATDKGVDSIKARKTITQWLQIYPDKEEAHFTSRLTSFLDSDHLAAFFEMYIYNLFIANGYEPERGGMKMPDFNIARGLDTFQCECTLAGDSIHQRTFFKCFRGFNKLLSSIPDPYSIHIDVAKEGENELSLTKLKRFILNELNRNLNSTEFSREFGINDWLLNLEFFRKEHLEYCILGRLGGGFMKPIAHEVLFQALQDKRPNKYSVNEQPYIIAVNSLEPGLTKDEINKALFGDYNYPAFLAKDKNTSISGILLFNCLYPQWIELVNPQWIPNPHAKYPIDMPNLTIGFSVSEETS